MENRKKLLTVPEFSDELNISRACARRWLLEHKITGIKVGKRLIRIPASEVQRIINEGLRPQRGSK